MNGVLREKMRKVKQRALFYCRFVSGRYCPVLIEDGESYIHYKIANRKGFKAVYRKIWIQLEGVRLL